MRVNDQCFNRLPWLCQELGKPNGHHQTQTREIEFLLHRNFHFAR